MSYTTSGLVSIGFNQPVAFEVVRTFSTTTVLTRIARFELDPSAMHREALDLYFVGLLSGGVSPVIELRLYDMGAPNVPQVGDLRATITSNTTSVIVEETVALVASDAPTSPGTDPNDGTIYSAARVYEVRVIFTAGTGASTMNYDTVGVAG
jgi:hypothetical protein